MDALFFELLQVADGSRPNLSRTLSDDEWLSLCKTAFSHRMLGVAFYGMDRLPKEQCPSKIPMVKMYTEAARISKLNTKFYSAVSKVSSILSDAGYTPVLLKGQGLSMLYPDKSIRTPGDIDIWLSGRRSDIKKFAVSHNTSADMFYHHIDFKEIDGCEVELHFTPSWMFSPIYNLRVQRWFRSEYGRLKSGLVTFDGGEVAVPDAAFNRIFVLMHIYRHVFDEGVGLRQIQDYYYVLKQGFSESEKSDTLNLLSRFGLLGFCSDVMYVLKTVFNIDDALMLVEPSVPGGSFLLSEIMKSGNFGMSDIRNMHDSEESAPARFFRKMKRMYRFIRFYPSEILWAPFFKFYNLLIRIQL